MIILLFTILLSKIIKRLEAALQHDMITSIVRRKIANGITSENLSFIYIFALNLCYLGQSIVSNLGPRLLC